MNKIKMSLFLISALGLTASYAGTKQNIQLCLDVSDNTSKESFVAGFTSSDIFDRGTSTGTLHNGGRCVNHIYNHGPKNIQLNVRVTGNANNLRDFIIVQDGSCGFLRQEYPAALKSDYIRAQGTQESWTIHLAQNAPMNGYKYSYSMSCTHVFN